MSRLRTALLSLSAATAFGSLVLVVAPAGATSDTTPVSGDVRAVAYAGNIKMGDCAGAGLAGTAVEVNYTIDASGTYITVTGVPEGTTLTGVVVKGGSAYNVYAGDIRTDLHAPLVSSGKPAQVSHWFACGTSTMPTTPPVSPTTPPVSPTTPPVSPTTPPVTPTTPPVSPTTPPVSPTTPPVSPTTPPVSPTTPPVTPTTPPVTPTEAPTTPAETSSAPGLAPTVPGDGADEQPSAPPSLPDTGSSTALPIAGFGLALLLAGLALALGPLGRRSRPQR